MRTIMAVLAALLIVAGLAPAASSTAVTIAAPPAVNDLKIVEVGTDAMGADTFANRNREFVRFQNVSGHAVDVANVVVEDSWAHGKTVDGVAHTCNTYKITDLPDNATTEIAHGEYVTVFNGVRWGGNYKSGSEYRLYANSDVDCGTAGQFFNNNNDVVYVALGSAVLASTSWDWNGGYTVVKP